MSIRTRFLVLLLSFGSAFSSALALAEGSIYTYTDNEGVVHFSDAPVDERYSRIIVRYSDGPVITPRTRAQGPSMGDFDGIIARVANRYGVRPALVKAVIAAESNFKPDAVSRVGAQGLMQLMPATARELGVERPFGAVENIDGGVRYLRAMLDRYGNVSRALAAYNAGPSAVDRHGGVPPYRETKAYVKRVLEYYRGYWNEFEAPSRPPSRRSVRVQDRDTAQAPPSASLVQARGRSR